MRFPLIVGVAGLAVCAPAQVTKSGNGYLLRVKYSAGQVIKLSTTNKIVNATGQQQDVTIELPVVLRVISVSGGNANTRMTVGPAMYGGKPMMASQTVVMKLNNRNQASGVQNGSASPGATLPEKPLKPGQTWSAPLPISTGTGSVQKVNGVYKFVGVKTVNGQGVAVISYTISGAANGSGTLTLLQKDGTLWTNTLRMQMRTGARPLTVVSTMKRI